MRVHQLLLAVLLALLLAVPGFAIPAGNSVSCFRQGGKCLAYRCKANLREIGTCGMPGIKCCRRK